MPRFLLSFVVLVIGFSMAVGVPAQQIPNILHQISDAQSDLYDKVGPSVVRILTKGSGKSSESSPMMNPEMFEGTPFEFYFKGPDGKEINPFQGKNPHEKLEEQAEAPDRITGVGSGMVIHKDESGVWILTNHHVIGDAVSLDIEFRDSHPITDLKLISDPDSAERNHYADEKSDLALIRLDNDLVGTRELAPLQFADSDALRVGQLVFTLGSPLNREQTFSQGIISAKDRSGVLPGMDPNQIKYEGFLQTTAFINVGNSGGPLLNVDGEVVGVDVAIQTAGGFSNGFVGIAFAIPSNRAKQVVDQLISTGKVVRGYLGVQIQPTDLDVSQYFKLPPRTGVNVKEVFPDTPAYKGGIKKNDIILSFNGHSVMGTNHLQDLVAQSAVNAPAQVEVLRGGEKVTLQVPIEQQPEEMKAAEVESTENNIPELGATLRDPDSEEAAYYKEGGHEGVMVADLETGGPLTDKIPKGSLITSIDRNKVTSVGEVKEVLAKILENRGAKSEIRVMVTYVPSSSENTEEFQIIKLSLK